MKNKFDSDYTEEEYNHQDRAELEEFNLSNEREKLRKYLKEQFGEKSIIPDDILNLVIEKDRKFIRLLKEDLSWNNTRKPKSEVQLDEIYKTIDKFVGDKRV